MRCRVGVGLVLIGLVATASADVPRDDRVPSPWDPGELAANGAIPYSTVYLNRCPNGCFVSGPAISSSIDNTWNINGPRMLGAFPYDDATWSNVVACVRDVFSPFLIDVVETDPGTANHFEVMVAGRPEELGLRSTLLGVAPGGCTTTYMNNALVFAFATKIKDLYGSSCGAACVNHICYAVTQELGHTWTSMDHVTVVADPMTYFDFPGRRYFQNTDAQCGSDCINGFSPDGVACSGQNHRCVCTTSQTQNTYSIVGNLFGLGPSSPPSVTIVGLSAGQIVLAGFPVVIDATDSGGTIARVELVVDKVLVGTLTGPPYVFNAPSTLMDGTHHVEAIAYDGHQTPGKATVDVVIGPPCENDCATATDVCIGGRCVAGSGVDGGLGTACTQPSDCISNQCASHGASMYCVETCMVGQCPDEFGCLALEGAGVCWPGYDDGSAGCGCRSNRPGGLATLLLWLAVGALLTRRRR